VRQTLVCPSCGGQNPYGYKFCGKCGAGLRGGQQQAYGLQQTYSCSKCGQAVAQGAKFCGSCGTSLDWQVEPTQQRAYGNQQEKVKFKKTNYRRIVYIALIAVVLLAGVYVLYNLISSEAPSSSSTPVVPPGYTGQE
jgi:uncharacterized membrane protein YvbJ